MRVSVIIPVYNKAELLREYVRCNMRHAGEPCEWIIIDNGSDEDTVSALNELEELANSLFHNFKNIRHEDNTGVAKAWNEGLSIASNNYVCILNNDCLLRPNWVESLISEGRRFALDIYSPWVIEPWMNSPNMNKKDFLNNFERLEKKNRKSVKYGIFGGVVFFGEKKKFENIGAFDSRYWLSMEDIDFCYRALQQNYKIGVLGSSMAFHLTSATRKSMNLIEHEKKNQAIFEEKFGFDYETIQKLALNKLRRSLNKRKWKWFSRIGKLREKIPQKRKKLLTA